MPTDLNMVAPSLRLPQAGPTVSPSIARGTAPERIG